jgi:hypothetical protein
LCLTGEFSLFLAFLSQLFVMKKERSLFTSPKKVQRRSNRQPKLGKENTQKIMVLVLFLGSELHIVLNVLQVVAHKHHHHSHPFICGWIQSIPT